MSPKLTQWKAGGTFIPFGPFRHKVFAKQIGNPDARPAKTLLLLHGFPESSYSFHGVVKGMLEIFDRIILFDFPGYGFSDKPVETFSYSLLEQADVALTVWKYFGIKGGHLLSHDMGDSVATELVARHENTLLPTWFSEGFQSLTFTNGSMVLEMSALRVTQKLLLSRFGFLMSKMTTFRLFNQQVRSAHGNNNLSAEAIQSLWEGNLLQDGHRKSYLTIKYLEDRKRFEKTRWLPALKQTKLPVHICWGDADAVAKVAMAHYLKTTVCTKATLTIMEGLGHFCQLGNPEKWVAYVGGFYEAMRSIETEHKL